MSFVASAIGNPIMLDKQTTLLEPFKYARICVYLSVQSTKLRIIHILVVSDTTSKMVDEVVEVEYPEMPHILF